LIAEVFPIDVWTYLRSTAWPAGIEIRSAIDVPWELATMDTPLHPDLPPLLGCQLALAIWPLESPRVRQREGDLPVRGIAALAPDGDSVPLLSRLGGRHYTALPEVLGDNSDIDVVHIAAEIALKPESMTGIELPRSPVVIIAGQVSVSLSIAFLRAGASAVVAAMSSVNYVDEKEFAERFYTEVLLESIPISEALRRLRCQSGPVGATALAYRYFGHPDLRLRWSGRPA
jgi:hypothetical protein